MGQRWHVGVAISKHCEGADPSSCTNGRKAQCQKHSSQQDVCTQATFSSWPWGTNLPRKEPSTCGVHCSEDKKMPTNLSLKPDELNLRQKTKNMLFPRRYFCHIITKCYRKQINQGIAMISWLVMVLSEFQGKFSDGIFSKLPTHINEIISDIHF
jgi:hypothetical protein